MRYIQKYKTSIGMLLVWTSLITGSLIWNVMMSRDNIMSRAYDEARTSINKDITFRLWGASHGGVYVPVSEKQKPIKWLSHIPDRDVVKPDGKMLTLVNPAAMLRQLSEQYAELFGAQGRITSLNPLNEKNAPDDWETRLLKEFEKGEINEAWETEIVDGVPYLRYIRAMETEAGCLKCHANQGYRVGDIRGGLGVKLPLTEHYRIIDETERNLTVTHLLLWSLGLVVIFRHSHISESRNRERASREIEREVSAEKIAHLAHHDVLTRLHNRYSMEEKLNSIIDNAQINDHKAAILFIDLDRFKTINDSLGHPFGDKLLLEVANQLATVARDIDTLARIGGDEFVLLIPRIRDTFEVAAVAQRIQNKVNRLYSIDNRTVETSASTGICIFPDDGESVSELLKNADIAMYQAKMKGRNNFQFFTESLSKAADERLKLESQMRTALEDQQFELYFQPIVGATEQKIVSAETLIRWKHPEHGFYPPDKFIPIAEETGFIHLLGDWILEEACRCFSVLKARSIPLDKLSVNLSVYQLQSSNLTSKVKAAMQKYDIAPGELEFEITETAAMQDPDYAVSQLRALSLLGVSLAIDDFGTGYSSLTYLKKLPIQTLKVDRSFVRDIGQDVNDEEICTTTINLAHNLGLKVVAEGVETLEQIEFLRHHGCDRLQGYYFSKPVPLEALSPLFEQDQPTPDVV